MRHKQSEKEPLLPSNEYNGEVRATSETEKTQGAKERDGKRETNCFFSELNLLMGQHDMKL